jgi:hypothetical protein
MQQPGLLAQVARAKDGGFSFVEGPGWHLSIITEGVRSNALIFRTTHATEQSETALLEQTLLKTLENANASNDWALRVTFVTARNLSTIPKRYANHRMPEYICHSIYF